MIKKEKRIRKIIQNPKSVTFNELKAILINDGYTLYQASGSSHFTFYNGEAKISIPYYEPHLKAVYVKKVPNMLGVKNENE